MSCPSATLTVWCAAWLHGAAASDDVIDALHSWGDEHEFQPGDDATATVLGLAAERRGLTAAEFLTVLRKLGAATAWLVLPVPGDVRGLGDHPEMRKTALRTGEAAVFPGIATGALGVVGEQVAEGLTRWTVFDMPAPAVPEHIGIGEAERSLNDAVRDSAATLQELDLTGERPGAHDELAARLRSRPHTGWPRGTPQRTLRVLQRTDELAAIIELAHRTDPGGAQSASAVDNRTAALQPVTAAVRAARCAATDEAVRILTRQHNPAP